MSLETRMIPAVYKSLAVESKNARRRVQAIWTLGMKQNSWVRLLTYITGLVNQELLLQNEYLAAENRSGPP